MKRLIRILLKIRAVPAEAPTCRGEGGNMEKLIKNILGIALLFVSAVAHGQADAEMADVMRSEGKIYVVVGIILIVLTGLVVYLFILDRKVKKLENLLEEKNRK